MFTLHFKAQTIRLMTLRGKQKHFNSKQRDFNVTHLIESALSPTWRVKDNTGDEADDGSR